MAITRLSLPSLVSNGMIIQQNQPFVLRGSTDPLAFVTVSLTRKPVQTSRPVSPLDPDYGVIFETGASADIDGRFRIELPSLAASFDPLTLTVSSGTDRVDVTDILSGEVWICLGGDNMAMPVRAAANGRHMLEQANTPYVRFFTAEKQPVEGYPSSPQTDFPGGRWIYGDVPAEVAERSAVAFSFARELCADLHMPVAVFDLPVRRSHLHAFLPRQVIDAEPRIKDHLAALGFDVDKKGANTSSLMDQDSPSALYNTLLAPLLDLGAQGILWMHGEVDFPHPSVYATGFARLLEHLDGWLRPADGHHLNLIYALLPPFYTGFAEDRALARFNEILAGSRQNLSRPAGLTPLYDLPPHYKDAPEPYDCPWTPSTKQPVGQRMKKIATGLVYQRKAPASAPECSEFEIVGSKFLVSFSHVLNGLRLTGDDSRLRGFSICGTDRVFVEASARLLYGVRVLVWHDQIDHPVAVSYADQDINLGANLIGRDGLPVVPFRTDQVASRHSADLEWLHCEQLRIWAVDAGDPGSGPAYRPVYRVPYGKTTIQVEKTNKSEGDGSLHLQYETDADKRVGLSPILEYPSLYPPHDWSDFAGLSVDIFNPDLQFKSLAVELMVETAAGPDDEAPADQTRAVRLGPSPVEPALRWQTLSFNLESMPVARDRIRGVTLVLSDRKGRGQVFIDNIRLLLP